MDFLDVLQYISLFLVPILLYLICVQEDKSGKYSKKTWYFLLKKKFAKKKVEEYLIRQKINLDWDNLERPSKVRSTSEEEAQQITCSDQKGNTFFIKFSIRADNLCEVTLQLKLSNGNIYELPSAPKSLLSRTRKREWKADGLEISCLEPYDRYRIFYNGFLKCGDKISHCKLNVFWKSSSEPMCFPTGFEPNLFLTSIATEQWRNPYWINMLGDQKGYSHFGVVHGEFSCATLKDECVLNLPGHRMINLGTANRHNSYREIDLLMVSAEGTCIHLCLRSFTNGCTLLKYGGVYYGTGLHQSIESTDVTLETFGEGECIPTYFKFMIKCNKKEYTCEIIGLSKNCNSTINDELKGGKQILATGKCNFGNLEGKAVVSFWYQMKGRGVVYPKSVIKEYKHSDSLNDLIVSLDDDKCRITEFTGGKAYSLAALKSLNSGLFSVPDGFVVTVASFKKQINENKNLLNAVDLLGDSATNNTNELKEICQKLVNLFSKETINEEVTKLIITEINKYKTKSPNENIKWAVRSSGVNEDGEELSAAGQNDTFLRCESNEQILTAVSACWGSLFSFQSVQYRRLHGLPVITEMAVVIQKMVPSASAGVLFTCHPTTADTSKMVITSNFGLGESVVSGQTDPDTITLGRTFDGKLNIENVQIGDKKEQIFLDDQSDNIKESDLSITHQQALKLGEIGLFLESKFGSPRDIEWAFVKGQLHLLQCRPVTSISNYSGYDLENELNQALTSEINIYTIANVKEVLIGAQTPLTQSVVAHLIDNSGRIITGIYNQFTPVLISTFKHNSFIDILNSLLKFPPEKVNIMNLATDISIFGHPATTPEMLQVATLRNGPPTLYSKLHIFTRIMVYLFQAENKAKKAVELGKINIDIGSNDSAKEVFEKITKYLKVSQEISDFHMYTSRASSFYQILSTALLTKNNPVLTNEHYGDIALLFSSSSEIISADIPVALENIAAVIKNSPRAAEFIQVDSNEGYKWLKENVPKAADLFDNFMLIHGHRSGREFELAMDSWSSTPEIIISSIQMNVKSTHVSVKSPQLSPKETIKKLKTPLSGTSKKILEFLASRGRKGVSYRETTKCELIRSVAKLKVAFKHLANLMVKMGKIPSQKLIFYFTNFELKYIINNTDPALVSKAIRRQKMYPIWDKYVFNEIIFGLPTPINDEISETTNNDNTRLLGTPVFIGEVKARCCCVTIDEIDQIQPGDILITNSTDIRWSPIFPILSGVVTELGGLISHGAVVAREYGLPCLVGVAGATKAFKTGDTLYLSGKDGYIELIERNEN